MAISLSMRMRNVSSNVVMNIKKNLCILQFSENLGALMTIWNNTVQTDGPQMKMSCCVEKMRFACQVIKARTDTRS